MTSPWCGIQIIGGGTRSPARYVGKIKDGDSENPRKVREIVAIRGIYEIGHLELAYGRRWRM